jgi:hypothetical protein
MWWDARESREKIFDLSAQIILEYFGEVSSRKGLKKWCWKFTEGALVESSWNELKGAGAAAGFCWHLRQE